MNDTVQFCMPTADSDISGHVNKCCVSPFALVEPTNDDKGKESDNSSVAYELKYFAKKISR